MKKVSLVVVPDYLLTTMKSVGVSLTDLNVFGIKNRDLLNNPITDGNDYNRKQLSYEPFGGEDIFKYLKSKLSNNDISDLVNVNDIFNRYVLNNYAGGDGGLRNEITYLQFNNYFNDNSNKEDILKVIEFLNRGRFIISEDNYKETFSFHYEDNTLFLILKNGFGNLISCNRQDLKDLILDLIIEQSFNKFGEQTTINSSMFSCYLGKLLNKK